MLSDLAHVERDDKPVPSVILIKKRQPNIGFAGGKDSRPLKALPARPLQGRIC
jgi:hypothetical protein